MKLVAMLTFYGNARQALDYYVDVFQAESEVTFYKDYPELFDGEVPDEIADLIVHGTIRNDDFELYLYDEMDDSNEAKFNHAISLMLVFGKSDRGEKVFRKLSEDGQIIQDFEITAFSPGYGVLIDQFGVEWQIIVE